MPFPGSMKVLFVAALCYTFDRIDAWGREGHAIVADIAYERLSASTQNEVGKILFPNGTTYDESKYASPLSAVASWADAMRYTKEFAWTTPLHFVDIRDDLIPGGCPSTSSPINPINAINLRATTRREDEYNCTFVYDRDCDGGLCAVNAIQQLSTHLYNQTLGDNSAGNIFLTWQNTPGLRRRSITNVTTRESLMFLIHFIGDIHQPLHVSRKTDIGGNSIHVSFPILYKHHLSIHRDERAHHFLHKGWNLHSVWDDGIIEYSLEKQFNQTQSKFQKHIEQWYINDENVEQWTECADGRKQSCVSFWAEESWNDALNWAYGDELGNEIKNGAHITEAYINSRLPIVESRLAAGGVRLAFVLEMIYGNT